MGHSNISTTQGYARITEDKISKEMDKLMEKEANTAHIPAMTTNDSFAAACLLAVHGS